MKVYLDTCSLHRPLDDKTQPRVALESEAVLAVLAVCERGSVSLVSSDILLFEVGRNPHPQRKAYVSEVIARAPINVSLTASIEQRAKELEDRGFKGLDALHVAAAEAEHVDYFCTCDDRLLKRARSQSDLMLKVVSPLELAQEIVT
jgi:predicted nucleic acid-binding protein